ncbi:hypothetical protein EfmGK923_19270 [Enterococcus faecium]|nr:hypothetical protein EfmGK923_19270 [Enterococcus faecium]
MSEIIWRVFPVGAPRIDTILNNRLPSFRDIILKECKFMIGNSSSGIIEAASFKIPVINLGTRQNGREQSKNIINANLNENANSDAGSEIQDPQFIKSLKNVKNIYGDGNSSRRITKTLNQILNDGEDIKWIQKQIAY